MTLKLITIGGSAGSIASISELLKQLPRLQNAAICITVHIPSKSPSLLPQIFANATQMPVMHAQHGLELRAGSVYVAPPDFHLIIKGKRIELARGARENHHRPAIDSLFRSAAYSFGPNHIAVLLSGYLDDGSAGLLAVKRTHGTIIIQDPADTLYPDMPNYAIHSVAADRICPLKSIVPFIMERLLMISGTAKFVGLKPGAGENEVEMVKLIHGDSRDESTGNLCEMVCPECSGPLWEIQEANSQFVRFRCHEGHAYSALSLENGHNEALEAALWTAMHAMDEKVELTERLMERSKKMGHDQATIRYRNRYRLTKSQAELIRKLLDEALASSKE